MNVLATMIPGPNTIIESATGITDGDAQLYRWELPRLGFKYEAWVSYSGDYTLAKSEMWRAFEAHRKEQAK